MEQRIVGCAHEVKLYEARYEVATKGHVPEHFESVFGRYKTEFNSDPRVVNPITGRPARIANDTDYLGNFSYCAEYSAGAGDPVGVVITYAPARLWELPKMIWIGGECGNNQEWLARGLTPAEALSSADQLIH